MTVNRVLTNVVLPAPFGPIIPNDWPSFTWKFKLDKTCFLRPAASPVEYDLQRPTTFMASAPFPDSNRDKDGLGDN
jgi:hypothetical protein